MFLLTLTFGRPPKAARNGQFSLQETARMHRDASAQSLQIEAIERSSILIEHDLFGKPGSTFPDHALAPLFAEVPVMSESLASPMKPAAMRSGVADLQALAQVEKWMTMIREISREQRGEIKHRA